MMQGYKGIYKDHCLKEIRDLSHIFKDSENICNVFERSQEIITDIFDKAMTDAIENLLDNRYQYLTDEYYMSEAHEVFIKSFNDRIDNFLNSQEYPCVGKFNMTEMDMFSLYISLHLPQEVELKHLPQEKPFYSALSEYIDESVDITARTIFESVKNRVPEVFKKEHLISADKVKNFLKTW